MNDSDNSTDIDAIAADWAVKASARDLDQEERARLEAWLASDSRHLGAYVRAQAIWQDLDRVAAMANGADPKPEPAQVHSRSHRRPHGRSRGRGYAIAASVVLGLSALAGVLHQQFSGRYVAGVGEILRIALDDGSTVMLNTDSAIRVRYDHGRRQVLLDRGEATFQVTRDIHRPFVVEAGKVAARAVGTQFAVRKLDDAVSVTVIEGVVEVKRPGAARQVERRIMRKNDQVMVASAQPIHETDLSTREVAQRFAWREGYLVFDGERLDAAAAEMNRYSTVPIRIADPALAAEQFIGVFQVGDARAFARSAVTAFDASLREESGAIVLTRRPPVRTE